MDKVQKTDPSNTAPLSKTFRDELNFYGVWEMRIGIVLAEINDDGKELNVAEY
jgi:hypothetical protein